MKLIILIISTFLGINSFSQIVNIPDTNFKNYLLGNSSINTNLDTAIQVTEANSFNGTLTINNLNIGDLTGIEAFVNLQELHCNKNQITNLNVSNSSNLTVLDCSENLLTLLDVSGNNKLEQISAYDNQLTFINLSNIDSLKTFTISDNSLSNINLSNNLKLYLLNIDGNPLTNLILTNNSLLQQVYIRNTQISSLDFSNNPNLQLLFLDTNTNLTSLNLKNGNNTNIFNPSLYGNSNLTCIQVDDSAYSSNNWTNIDAQHFFSENCTTSIDEFSDNYRFNIYPNPANINLTVVINNNVLDKSPTIQLTNISGKVVLQKPLKSFINTINVSSLSKGFYTLSIQNNSTIFAAKKVIISQ